MARAASFLDDLAREVGEGNRRALGRAITLVESTREDHRQNAELLLKRLKPKGKSLRLGISGAPGVGKSSFIEAFGLHLIDEGEKVAVLAVDPSSGLTGGSILGDKTRMNELSRRAESFIRPSPSGGSLGGVARRTRESIAVCEAAGFSVIIIETVGVGQSETAVAEMSDMFILLQSPGGGDELQGIKRGIMELVDLIAVTKADGDFTRAANHAVSDYRSALSLFRPKNSAWRPRVIATSSLEKRGMEKVWRAARDFRQVMQEAGLFDRQREEQRRQWMWTEVEAGLLQALQQDEPSRELARHLEQEVAEGREPPASAARRIIEKFLAG